MNLKIVLLVFQAVFAFLGLLLVRSMLRVRTLFDLLNVFFILASATVVFFLANRKLWLGFALSSWMVSVSIARPPLDSFTVGFLIYGLICGLFVIEKIMQRKAFFSLKGWGNCLLLVATALLFIRFFMDRPGSARMGGIGGLRNALGYTAVLPFFFISEQLGREQTGKQTRSFLRVICWVGISMVFWRLFRRLMGTSAQPIYMAWYEGSLWLLMPLALAWLLYRRNQEGSSPVPSILFSLFMLLLGVLSPFRSRIYFALASIAAVFWCSGYRRRFVIGSAIVLSLLMPLLVVIPRQHIPVFARRALSTVLPFDRADLDAVRERGVNVSSEYGWGSGFRAFLFQAAANNIKRNPWMGQGWGVSRDDLVLASSLDPAERLMYALVAAGEYHNSLLTVAVKSGLPAGLLTAIGFVLVGVSCFRNVDRVPSGELKMLYVGVVGALVTITGQMLMNGSYSELQGVAIYLGFLHGTLASPAVRVEENRIEAAS